MYSFREEGQVWILFISFHFFYFKKCNTLLHENFHRFSIILEPVLWNVNWIINFGFTIHVKPFLEQLSPIHILEDINSFCPVPWFSSTLDSVAIILPPGMRTFTAHTRIPKSTTPLHVLDTHAASPRASIKPISRPRGCDRSLHRASSKLS